MRNIVAILQKELKHYFVSPIAYVVLMIFLTVSGYFFFAGMRHFSLQYQNAKMLMQIYRNPEILQQFNLNDMVIAPALFNMIFVFLFLLPLVMMRSLADEKRQKTDELLFTSPVTINQIIAGKFLGAMVFVMAMVLPTTAYPVALIAMGARPEIGPILTGYGGVMLFAACGAAIGLFASSLTENQIIAAVVTFVILLFMFIINFLGQEEGSPLFAVIRYLSVAEHIRNLLRGLVDTRDLFYFLNVAALFLFLTKRSVEAKQWR